MEKLNFEQMENIQGGVNCFLTGMEYVACGGFGPVIGTALGVSSGIYSAASYCWNS